MSEFALAFDALDQGPEQIAARFRWARAAGHPHYVWPDVPVDAWQHAVGAIRATVRAVLARDGDVISSPSPVESAPVPLAAPGIEARALGTAALTTGTGPLLGWWIERGRVRAAPEVADLLALHLRHGRQRARRSAALLEHVAGLLAQPERPVVALKGAHTALTLFPEPGARPAADLDLLVHDLSDSARSLVAAGYRPGPRKDHPPTQEWTAPGESDGLRSLDLTHADNPLGLDLHGTLDRDFFRVGTVRFGVPRPDQCTPLPDVRDAVGLREPLLSAFLAVHASHGLHNLTLLRLIELVWALRKAARDPDFSWDGLSALLAAAGGMRFVLPAFAMADRLAPGAVDASFLARVRAAAPARMRRVVDGLEPGSVALERVALDQRLAWADSPAELARTAFDFLWPASAGDSWARRATVWKNRVGILWKGRVERS